MERVSKKNTSGKREPLAARSMPDEGLRVSRDDRSWCNDVQDPDIAVGKSDGKTVAVWRKTHGRCWPQVGSVRDGEVDCPDESAGLHVPHAEEAIGSDGHELGPDDTEDDGQCPRFRVRMREQKTADSGIRGVVPQTKRTETRDDRRQHSRKIKHDTRQDDKMRQQCANKNVDEGRRVNRDGWTSIPKIAPTACDWTSAPLTMGSGTDEASFDFDSKLNSTISLNAAQTKRGSGSVFKMF
eukprot:927677-Rhodomonas_salina.7